MELSSHSSQEKDFHHQTTFSSTRLFICIRYIYSILCRMYYIIWNQKKRLLILFLVLCARKDIQLKQAQASLAARKHVILSDGLLTSRLVSYIYLTYILRVEMQNTYWNLRVLFFQIIPFENRKNLNYDFLSTHKVENWLQVGKFSHLFNNGIVHTS